jgi:HD-GYP domain-containing protein (c-di-GMP phosphodiesterase class II)
MQPGVLLHIDRLIDIVNRGGAVKTGVNVFDSQGILMLEKDVLVNRVTTLLHLKSLGVSELPFDPRVAGGLWNSDGESIQITSLLRKSESTTASEDDSATFSFSNLGRKIQEIHELKKEAKQVQETARQSITQVFQQVKQYGDGLDQEALNSAVGTILSFLESNSAACAFLSREIFSHDDYLYSHSVNVCTLGSALLKKFNNEFNQLVNRHLIPQNTEDYKPIEATGSFILYQPEEIQELSLGLFLHDIGKTLVPESIFNKSGSLSDAEFEEIKRHSTEHGSQLLIKNNICSSMIRNVVTYHHAPLFFEESRTYPHDKSPNELPIYVKVCKLVDIFDAMTSKRAYREAINPVSVVAEIVRKYANKDSLLQLLLMVLVKTIGVYPPGSVIQLRNGQLAYVLESIGPVVIIFTDSFQSVLQRKPEPVDLGVMRQRDLSGSMDVDRRKPLLCPKDYFEILPPYLKE